MDEIIEILVEAGDVQILEERVSVELSEHVVSLEITNEVTEVIEVITEGPAGPRGESSAAGASYSHIQSVPSKLWTIVHALGRHPSVTVVDTAGSELLADIRYLNVDTVTVTAALPISGTAYLN